MSAFFRYAVVLAWGVAIGLCVNAPIVRETVAKLAATDKNDILIDDASARPRPEAAAIAVDPAGARRVDEDLDNLITKRIGTLDPVDTRRVDEELEYLIAKRIGTLDGWRAFLAAHESGAYAQSAKAQIDKLSLLATAPEPAAVEASDRVSPEAKVESEPARPAPPLEAAALPLDEVCNHERDCPGRSRSNPSSGETAPVANKTEPGAPGPQVASLKDGLAAAAAQLNSSAKDGADQGSKRRATALRRGTTVSSHIIPRPPERPCGSGFECRSTTQTLPPILLALLGVKTRHSTGAFGSSPADARPNGSRGR